MRNKILTKEQISKLVLDNKYKIDPQTQFFSRCIDDRYQDDIKLSPLALPGADAGQLAIIMATGNSYGLEIDENKTFEVLVRVLGGIKNLHFHTDSRNETDPLGGCGYFNQIKKDPLIYNLEEEQVNFIHGKANSAAIQGATDDVLEGDHLVGAILQIRGNWNIFPCYAIETVDGVRRIEFFNLHQTLIDKRHRVLAKELVDEGAVRLYQGCDHEYFYQALCETTEKHFFETARRLASGLPIYSVEFKDNGSYDIDEQGRL